MEQLYIYKENLQNVQKLAARDTLGAGNERNGAGDGCGGPK